jgi:hypothetical protein
LLFEVAASFAGFYYSRRSHGRMRGLGTILGPKPLVSLEDQVALSISKRNDVAPKKGVPDTRLAARGVRFPAPRAADVRPEGGAVIQQPTL